MGRLAGPGRVKLRLMETPCQKSFRAKNSGLAMVTLNLRFQPRLPGSVVGEASMRQSLRNGQDYRGQCPKVTSEQRKCAILVSGNVRIGDFREGIAGRRMPSIRCAFEAVGTPLISEEIKLLGRDQ